VAMASRASIENLHTDKGLEAVRELQGTGERVCYVGDNARAAQIFEHCDLAIGLSAGRGSQFPARADLLAPDVGGVALILEAVARQRVAARDSIGLSLVGNLVGAIWGFQGAPGVERASLVTYITALISTGIGWARLHGGERPPSILAQLADPRPERWGGRSAESVLQVMHSRPEGLTPVEALHRHRSLPQVRRTNDVVEALKKQLRSPLPAVLGVAGGLALAVGATLDFVLIMATIGLNLAVGCWQEIQTDRAAEALEKIGSPTAKVMRDSVPVVVMAKEVVPGDILILGSGDRISADARMLEAHGLEVDEAALTGESHPVAKMVEGGANSNHIVLEGSDVVVGTGRAIVIAVGRHTRLGATAAALALHDDEESPLGKRLAQLLRQLMPIVLSGGVVVVASGLLRAEPLLSSLAIGASIALASVPEGLPLLAGIGEAAVARRLSKRKALVRRLSCVEALGRVDVACTDKTGTLTTGKLAVRVVASGLLEAELPGTLPSLLRHVMHTAALASPHPEAQDVHAHPTDVAVIRAAEHIGL
ncbi:MAG TPA: HAD-IC family P-type ATPase, partial [Pirellulales bacterium]|nr:HAD-IC family P-type ATPase [Pirellulales bacterium]